MLYEDPWKLLVACMLLNKTSSTQVSAVPPDTLPLIVVSRLKCFPRPPPERECRDSILCALMQSLVSRILNLNAEKIFLVNLRRAPALAACFLKLMSSLLFNHPCSTVFLRKATT